MSRAVTDLDRPPSDAGGRTAPPYRLGRSRAAGAFFGKEVMDVVRQPWLLVVMVLGPFLVLVAFGVGYRDEVRPYRTLFVGDRSEPLAQRLEAAAGDLSGFVDYRGVIESEAQARRLLDRGKIDAYVRLPEDPLGTVLGGERAVLRVVHNQLDPIEQTAIEFASRVAVEEINASVLADLVGQGQRAAGPLTTAASDARALAEELLVAIDEGDTARIDELADELAARIGWIDGVALAVDRLATEAGTRTQALADEADQLARLSARARALVGDLRSSLEQGTASTARDAVADLAETLDEVEPLAQQLVNVEADVLVRPFASEVDVDVKVQRSIRDFYAPAAVALLLQQFGVAFGALTFVRERQSGVLDLYRVSPVSAGQTLIGKYGAYLALGGVAGLVLLALVVGASGVPFEGDVLDAAVAAAVVLFGSIGLGFLISLVSRTDTQAVLLATIVLLASLFFSGLFLPVDGIDWPLRAISYLLPATYGMEMLRDVALRGRGPATSDVIGALVVATVLAVAVFAGLRRRLAVT